MQLRADVLTHVGYRPVEILHLPLERSQCRAKLVVQFARDPGAFLFACELEFCRQRPEALVGNPELFLSDFVVRYVNHHRAHYRTVTSRMHADDVPEPDRSSIRRDHPVLRLELLTVARSLHLLAERQVPIVRMYVLDPETGVAEPPLRGIAQDPLNWPADECGPERLHIHLDNDPVYRIDEGFSKRTRVLECPLDIRSSGCLPRRIGQRELVAAD